MSADFGQVTARVVEAFEKVGLYCWSHPHLSALPRSEEDVAYLEEEGTDPVNAMKEGRADFFLAMTFQVGDVAWSDRVLNPEKFKQDQEFRALMPSEVELSKSEAVAVFLNWDDDDDLDDEDDDE